MWTLLTLLCLTLSSVRIVNSLRFRVLMLGLHNTPIATSGCLLSTLSALVMLNI